MDEIEKDFNKKAVASIKKGVEPVSQCELDKILLIKHSNTKVSSIINSCSDWVIDNHKDFARLPNDNEWQRFLKSIAFRWKNRNELCSAMEV